MGAISDEYEDEDVEGDSSDFDGSSEEDLDEYEEDGEGGEEEEEDTEEEVEEDMEDYGVVKSSLDDGHAVLRFLTCADVLALRHVSRAHATLVVRANLFR